MVLQHASSSSSLVRSRSHDWISGLLPEDLRRSRQRRRERQAEFIHGDGIDLIDGLYQRNMLHVLIKIFGAMDSMSLQQCLEVSTTWRRIVNECVLDCPSDASLDDDTGSLFLRRDPSTSTVHRGASRILAMNVDGQTVAIGMQNGAVRLLARHSEWTSEVHLQHPVTAVDLSEDVVIAGTATGMIKVLARNTAKEHVFTTLRLHRCWISSLIFLDDTLYSCSTDGLVSIMDRLHNDNHRWRQRAEWRIKSTVEAIDVRDDMLVVGGDGGISSYRVFPYLISQTRLARVKDCRRISHVTPEPCLKLRIISASAVLFVGPRSFFIKHLDLSTGSLIRTFSGHSGIISDFTVFEDFIVSCSYDGQLKIWDKDKEPCVRTLQVGVAVALHVERLSCYLAFEEGEVRFVDFWRGARTTEETAAIDLTPRFRRTCHCGFDFGAQDQTFHLFMSCPLQRVARRNLQQVLSSLIGNFFAMPQSEQLQVILYGDESLIDGGQAAKLQESVQNFANCVNAHQH